MGGTVCAIGGGYRKYFFLIDLTGNAQYKLGSEKLTSSRATCFINGDAECVAVGGDTHEGVEIWSVTQRKSIRILPNGQSVNCLASTNNILAVGSQDLLKLWDVRNWETLQE